MLVVSLPWQVGGEEKEKSPTEQAQDFGWASWELGSKSVRAFLKTDLTVRTTVVMAAESLGKSMTQKEACILSELGERFQNSVKELYAGEAICARK